MNPKDVHRFGAVTGVTPQGLDVASFSLYGDPFVAKGDVTAESCTVTVDGQERDIPCVYFGEQVTKLVKELRRVRLPAPPSRVTPRQKTCASRPLTCAHHLAIAEASSGHIAPGDS